MPPPRTPTEGCGVIDPPDLHPQDYANRVALRDRLRQVRVESYGSYRRMRPASAAAGLGGRFLEDCEITTQWGTRRLARWARLLEHRFRMHLTDLVVPDDDDLDAALLAVATPFGGVDEDQLHVRTVVNDLARIHRGQGLTNYALAKRIGCSNRAIARWSEKPDRCYLKTLQRYARGLGGSLALEVAPVSVAVPT
jgi:hypothetical protein